MIDRYQVIYDIERCTCHVPDACRDCSLYNPDDGNLDCMERLLQNAMTLISLDTVQQLQEQKPVAVYETKISKCACGNIVNRYWHPKFCGYCGKELMWY